MPDLQALFFDMNGILIDNMAIQACAESQAGTLGRQGSHPSLHHLAQAIK